MSGKNKRILIITERYAPEPFLVTDLAETLVKKGHKVTVITQIPSYPGDKIYKGYSNRNITENLNGVRVVRFRTVTGYSKSLFRKILNYLLFMVREIWYSFKESGAVDTVFVYHTGPLTQAVAIIPIKLFRKLPVTIWTQDVWPDAVFAYGFPNKGVFAILLKKFVKFIYLFCDHIFVTSPGFIKRLEPYVKDKNIQYVPQWIPDLVLKKEPHQFSFFKNKVKFIFTGNIGSMQALDLVIKAFSKVKYNNIILYILGDGNYKEKYEKLANELDADNIIFLGKVSQEKVLSCINECDYTVLSLSNNKLINLTIPAKFQTYLAGGKPILAINNGEVASYINELKIGISTNYNIESIINGIIEIQKLDSNVVKKRMESLLIEKFNKEKIIDQMIRIM